jgi:hypothetical protein
LWSSIDIGVQNNRAQSSVAEFGMSIYPDAHGRLALMLNKKF